MNGRVRRRGFKRRLVTGRRGQPFRESAGIRRGGGRGRGTRRVDKLQGARNNEAPVLGCIPEIGPSRGYKSHGTRRSSFVKRPIDEFQREAVGSVARGTNGYIYIYAFPSRPPFTSPIFTFLRKHADLIIFLPAPIPDLLFLFRPFLFEWR